MPENNHIIEQNVTEILENNYMPYAMSVIVSRAIPEIDGFKPAHRKLLYTMYKMGLLTGGRMKSADVVGQTMQLNPHGDGAIYETLVRLTRGNGALLHPFIDSKGNFGKQYSRDMAYAASRYTEVKLDEICNELFKEIDKNTVEFVDNYNGRMKEPLLFPTTFPNLLVTPNQGIAVGMASSICSFNLREVCETTIAYIKSKSAAPPAKKAQPLADFLSFLKAPDFSTGGELLYNEKELRAIYETGRGSFKVRAKYRFDKKNSCIEIFEIPYSTTAEVIIDKIIALVKAGKLKEINDIRDETDIGGLKITIDIKRSANPDHLMHKLYSMTTLSDSFSCNFNILVNGTPRVMGVRQILDEWIAFRSGCLKKRISYDIEKKTEKYHLLLGLSKIILDIDRAIAIIRSTEEDHKVIPNLMDGFRIDGPQAEYIAEIKLRNLNRQYLLGRTDEMNGLKKEIDELAVLLSDEEKILSLISKQLAEIAKKYGKPRLTAIINEENIVSVPHDVFIEDYAVKLFLSEHNYFKKISLASLRSFSGHNLKENDSIVQEIETTNKAEILMFSNRANVYKTRAHELNDSKASSLGDYLPNLLGLEDGERIIFMVCTYDYNGCLLFAFSNGKMAKIEMESYQTKVNRKKLLNAYAEGDIIFIDYLPEDADFVALRDSDKATLFNTSLIAPKVTKNSSGVTVYNLKKGSSVTKVMRKEAFVSEDIEYYRTEKIPSTGHFLRGKDKSDNISGLPC